MTIATRQTVLLTLIRHVASGQTEEQAIASVAAELALPEEAVRDVVEDAKERAAC